MKITDYAPRAAPFDAYLLSRGHDLTGIEVGVDVGAHAEAILRYTDVKTLHLVDPWPNAYAEGYVVGRMAALGFLPRVELHKMRSLQAATLFKPESLDFIYIDQHHEGDVVRADLHAWWPILRPGGLLGYRNYSTSANPELRAAIDKFVLEHPNLPVFVETGEIILDKPRYTPPL